MILQNRFIGDMLIHLYLLGGDILMKIKDLFKKNKTLLSFEIFPPKKDYAVDTIYDTIHDLKDLEPDYISVTYGAGGTSKDRTVEIASKIKNEYQIEALAHLTCISSTSEEIDETVEALRKNNINNILALRGDMPEGDDQSISTEYTYASDLIQQINKKGDFSIGGACYPEGHLECDSRIQDIKHLKEKVDAGVDFLITQLFFDNELFYRFMEELDLAGINIPVSAGIMPVLNAKQILRIQKLSGCSLPPKFKRILEKYEHNPEALKEAGEAYALEQIIDLMAWGIDGIHLYTMNKSETARKIAENIKTIRKISNKSL